MNVRQIIVLTLLLLSLTALAGRRTDKQMRAIALSQLTATTVNGARSMGALRLEKVMENKALTIYGDTTVGFCVVSRDDRHTAVVGLSPLPFVAEEMPDGFKWWLTRMTERLSDDAPLRTRSVTPVANFLKTTWGQTSPYNGACPTIGSRNCPTGCVATSMAQVMRYFSYPAKGKGVGYYTLNNKDHIKIINKTYAWEKMLPEYSSTSGSTNKKAVQELMADAGAAVHMKYTVSSGAAATSDAARAFFEHFSYDSLAIRYYLREYYTEEEWMGTIYNELALKRPIMFGGIDASKESGHSFLFSGCDEAGRLWVNWGWQGSCDGYYDIDNLKPDGDNYSDGQEMIIGLKPQLEPDADDEYTSQWGYDQPFTLKAIGRDSLQFGIGTYYNISPLYFKGKLLYRIQSQTDKSIDYKTMLDLEKYGDAVPTFYGYGPEEGEDEEKDTIVVSNLKAGVYELCFVSQAKGELTPRLLRTWGGTQSITFTKRADGTLIVEGDDPTAISAPHKTSSTTRRNTYDLRGRKTNGSPSSSGIYIIDGRKTIVP